MPSLIETYQHVDGNYVIRLFNEAPAMAKELRFLVTKMEELYYAGHVDRIEFAKARAILERLGRTPWT